MDVDIQIDKARGYVRVKVSGAVTDGDLLLGNELLGETPGFHSGLNQLVDMTAVTDSSVTAKGLTRFTSAAPMFNANSKRALVAPSDLAFGFSRMVELRRGGDAGTIAVFRNAEEAEQWLLECGSDSG